MDTRFLYQTNASIIESFVDSCSFPGFNSCQLGTRGYAAPQHDVQSDSGKGKTLQACLDSCRANNDCKSIYYTPNECYMFALPYESTDPSTTVWRNTPPNTSSDNVTANKATTNTTTNNSIPTPIPTPMPTSIPTPTINSSTPISTPTSSQLLNAPSSAANFTDNATINNLTNQVFFITGNVETINPDHLPSQLQNLQTNMTDQISDYLLNTQSLNFQNAIYNTNTYVNQSLKMQGEQIFNLSDKARNNILRLRQKHQIKLYDINFYGFVLNVIIAGIFIVGFLGMLLGMTFKQPYLIQSFLALIVTGVVLVTYVLVVSVLWVRNANRLKTDWNKYDFGRYGSQ